MTLVIAGVRNGRIFVISDTQINLPGGSKDVPQLKVTFAADDVAVAFAGSPELASREVAQFLRQQDYSYDAAKEFFPAASLRAGSDFFICFAKTAQILKVKNGHQTKVESLDWIGDHQGFRALQKHRLVVRSGKVPGPEWTMDILPDVTGIDHVFEWVSAFRAAVESRELNSVGGFFSVVTSRDGKIGFSAHILNYADRTALLPDEFGRHEIIAEGVNKTYRAVTLPPSPAHQSAAMFGFPADNHYFLFTPSADRPFGFFQGSITNMTMEDAVKFAQSVSGIEFVPHDSWPA